MRYGNDGVYTFIVIFNNDTERTIEGENIEEAMDNLVAEKRDYKIPKDSYKSPSESPDESDVQRIPF